MSFRAFSRISAVSTILTLATAFLAVELHANDPAQNPAQDRNVQAQEQKCLQRALFRLLNKISDPLQTREFKPAAPLKLAKDKKLNAEGQFHPQIEATNAAGQALFVETTNPMGFLGRIESLHDHGFWILFSPSGPEARVATGHFLSIVKGIVFNRNVDEAGANALYSMPILQQFALPEVQGFLEHAMIAAQYFELTPESTATLEKFFHDRVWFHHQGSPSYASKYVPLPYTRDAGAAEGENCLTFAYPFWSPRWTGLRPELVALQSEIGPMKINEIPSRQLFNNAEAPSYRGTLFINNDPDQLKTKLMNVDAAANDPILSQLLLKTVKPAPKNFRQKMKDILHLGK